MISKVYVFFKQNIKYTHTRIFIITSRVMLINTHLETASARLQLSFYTLHLAARATRVC